MPWAWRRSPRAIRKAAFFGCRTEHFQFEPARPAYQDERAHQVARLESELRDTCATRAFKPLTTKPSRVGWPRVPSKVASGWSRSSSFDGPISAVATTGQ